MAPVNAAFHPAPGSCSSPSLSSSSSRNLWSRIGLPFASRTRTVSEFYIRPDEPYRQYSPGDLVPGAVVLTVLKPIRITHLVISLRGHVQVFKSGTPADRFPNDNLFGPGRAKRTGEYFGNGCASLFHDEVVLCGEGRLDVGVYEFNYELEFPQTALPSSIDFERGTISYTLTSTLTRPATISPTMTCKRKLQLVETVDVGRVHTPKPRMISLEPIARRSRARDSPRVQSISRSASSSNPTTTPPQPDAAITSDAAHSGSSSEVAEPPRSPALSEMSGASVTTASTGSFRFASLSSANTSNRRGSLKAGNPSLASRTITATVEVQRGGGLPGDHIPLKVSIKHTKPIKSLQGIIITLYRQGRIDSHPVIPVAPFAKGKGAASGKDEEYYPKSRTGLGGLSLSSAGSSSVFRKDLYQTIAPLVITPTALEVEVKTSIRIPEDAFPTIASVPGAMITFKYYVEVVVDISGKLAGQERFLPRLDLGTVPVTYGLDSGHPMQSRDEASGSVLSAWRGSIIDTDQVRRQKSVVVCLFEIVVGTKDSSRGPNRRGKERLSADADPRGSTSGDKSLNGQAGEDAQSQGPSREGISRRASERQEEALRFVEDAQPQQPAVSVPPPETPDDDSLDEKSRIRRAEERLLPSRPPDLDGSSSSMPPVYASAPPLSDARRDHVVWADGVPHGLPEAQMASFDVMEGSSTEPYPDSPRPQAPSREASQIGPTSDDKHELERRRLQLEASAPEDFPDCAGDGEDGEADVEAGSVPHSGLMAPSAPALDDLERPRASDATDGARVPELLPRYET